ncbi:MAG: UpxY family transcription antiterminator [Acidobacteria bacterium]|nr:UpxY family transcription antiterminator [Acidobacteriota bacterium]
MSPHCWYALTVRPRHERTASQYLRNKGLEEFAPVYRVRRRWSDRFQDVEMHLFPGYIFSRFSYEERLQVLGTPGITSIVGFAKTPAPVPDLEVTAIQAMLRSGRRVEPWPYLRAGDRVRIEEGCLEGLCGTLVREKDEWRVVVNVEILQRSVAVEIDRGAVAQVCPNSFGGLVASSKAD